MLRGSQLVISCSQASSGASVCVVRSRNGLWQTSDKVLETDGFCVGDAAQSFLGLGKGNADAVQHIKQEKYPL